MAPETVLCKLYRPFLYNRLFLLIIMANMKMVIDLRLNDTISPAAGEFFEELWLELAKQHQETRFIFLGSEKPVLENIPSNISLQALKSSSFKWLDQKKLLNLLVERNAEKYITIWNKGLYMYEPVGRDFPRKSLQQAAAVIYLDRPAKPTSAAYRNENKKQVIVTPALPEASVSGTWTETENTKIKYTGGKDFFLFTGDIVEQSQLIELLKAFSIFKKWQQSNMQLVIAGYNTHWAEEVFKDRLSTYKYRDDIVLLTDLPDGEIAGLATACYAMVFSCAANGLPLPLLYAVRAGAALMAADKPENRGWLDSALWVDTQQLINNLAQAMILLFKDENEKGQYTRRIKAEQAVFDRQAMLNSIWEIIKQ
jgi:hypothetical protein